MSKRDNWEDIPKKSISIMPNIDMVCKKHNLVFDSRQSGCIDCINELETELEQHQKVLGTLKDKNTNDVGYMDFYFYFRATIKEFEGRKYDEKNTRELGRY